MTEKTNSVTLLKNENGDYFLEISPEICDQLGLIEGVEYDLKIVGNGIEFKSC